MVRPWRATAWTGGRGVLCRLPSAFHRVGGPIRVGLRVRAPHSREKSVARSGKMIRASEGFLTGPESRKRKSIFDTAFKKTSILYGLSARHGRL